MGLIILEPNHSGKDNYYDTRNSDFKALVSLETIILFMYASELFMDVYHRSSDDLKSFWRKYIRNFKTLIKAILFVLFFTDAVIFYANIPQIVFRFSRIFRPRNLEKLP